MHQRAAVLAVLALVCSGLLGLAAIAEAARPGPLTCHKIVCALPGPCQVREQEKCVTGGGPPRCPAIIDAPDGTSCDDASVCTSGDVCTAGVCAGQTLACESSTDSCEPTSGCATTCGPEGCLVSAASEEDATLTIPAGALSASVRISMVDLGPNPDPGDPRVFRIYDLAPDGTTFTAPATLDLPAPPLAAGETAVIEVTDPASPTGWTEIATTLAAGRVTGDISHFSMCRTRAKAPTLSTDLIMVDMVEFQNVYQPVLRPDGLVVPGCDPGFSLSGICFTVRNSTASPVSSGSVRIFPWQCYNTSVILDYVNPATGEYEGEHCLSTSLLVPCGDLDVTLPLPAGGLLPGQDLVVPYDFEGSPLYACFGSSFVGVDVTLREPTTGDPAAGIRSAKDGPFVDVYGNIFQGIYPVPKVGSTRTIKNFLIDARF